MDFSRLPLATVRFLERGLGWSVLLLMAVIIVSMALQVLFRFVLRLPLTYTDEIAQISLTWLTFLGAAMLYRGYGHITVEIIDFDRPGSKLVLMANLIREFVVAATVILLLVLVYRAAPLAMRLTIGTLELTRFFVHFLPFGIGCAAVLVFVLEHIARDVSKFAAGTGHRAGGRQ